MAAEAQHFFDLFDSYWFAHQIFNRTHKDDESIVKTTQTLDFPAVPTVNVRSYSDRLFIDANNQSFISDSPNSVLSLQTPKLQTIEVEEFQELPVEEKDRVSRRQRKRMIKSKSKSKSLSELEFEEVKGFMDLGFVFSEKDRDSNLVSIIPGLQRLGKDEKEQVDGYVAASRPYLSEAWDDLKSKREEEALRMIKIPALGNEIEIKNQLRFWAHSVASVVG